MNTEIFKLIFEHDLRLEQLSGEADPRRELQRPSTLEEFLKPVPVYSKFYFTGTRIETGEGFRYGFTSLSRFETLFARFAAAIGADALISRTGITTGEDPLSAWRPSEAGETIVLCSTPEITARVTQLLNTGAAEPQRHNAGLLDPQLSVREKIAYMTPVLDAGAYVLFTEQAHNGLDLHLFSKTNIYERFFEQYQPLTGSPAFRFFSINGKRAKSERLFYFETWTLDRPPHGFEEVFPETRLR